MCNYHIGVIDLLHYHQRSSHILSDHLSSQSLLRGGQSGVVGVLTKKVNGQHGAEVLAQVMRASFTPLIQVIYEQKGFVI